MYVGRMMSSDAKIDKEIDCRLAKAISSFGRLYEQVWNNKHLKNNYEGQCLSSRCLPHSSLWLTTYQNTNKTFFYDICLPSAVPYDYLNAA